MSNVRSFDEYVLENTPHCTAELICVNCKERWIGTWPEPVLLKELTCPYCKFKGAIITTGQYLPEVDY